MKYEYVITNMCTNEFYKEIYWGSVDFVNDIEDCFFFSSKEKAMEVVKDILETGLFCILKIEDVVIK